MNRENNLSATVQANFLFFGLAQCRAVDQRLGLQDGLFRLEGFHGRNVGSLVLLASGHGSLLLGLGGKLFLVDRELNGVRLGAGSQVVHTRLESLLPGIKVHRGEFLGGGFGNVNIQTLALANVGGAIGGKIQNDSLRNLPDGLVDISELLGNFFNLLN